MSDPTTDPEDNHFGAFDHTADGTAAPQPVTPEPVPAAETAGAPVSAPEPTAEPNPYRAPRASYAAPTPPADPPVVSTTTYQPRPRRRGGLIVLVVVLALIAGALSGVTTSLLLNNNNGGNTATSSSSSSSGANNSTGIKSTTTAISSSLTKVINSKLSSIVTVSIVTSSGSGTGSGVVIDNKGDIVTNAHVATLEGASATGTLTVRTSSGDTYKASLVGYDATADVAVIKVSADAKGINPITFADSDDIQVGDTAIAIGSPLGLSGTVTAGIVSALNRPIDVQSAAVTGNAASTSNSAATVALSAIQTDAAINEGNSGGALLDANGNLIGLNDAIATSGDSSGSIGIGFSIPSDYVKRIAEELISGGKAEHAYLGVSLTDYVPTSAAFESGAKIQSISSTGPAAKAALQTGDVIVKINNTAIESSTQATALIKEEMPGSKISLTYTRGGTSHTITVTLGKLASN